MTITPLNMLSISYLLLIATTVTSNPKIRTDSKLPLVGIITIESSRKEKKHKTETELGEMNLESIIPKSYVDYVSQTGAIPIIIPYDLPLKKFEKMIESVDMLLLPGGNMKHTKSSHKSGKRVLNHYASRIDHAYYLAMYINEIEDRYFPVVSICFNFETFMLVFSGYDTGLLEAGVDDVYADHEISSYKGYLSVSKFWGNWMYPELEKRMEASVFFFNHEKAIRLDKFLGNSQARDNIMVTSTFKLNGVEYIASAEHKDYPFFATQFHPEKNQFEKLSKKLEFVDRSYATLDVIRFEIANLVQKVRDNLGEGEEERESYKSVVEGLKEYSTLILRPKREKYYGSFDMIYAFPRYSRDSGLKEKVVMAK